MNFPVLLFFLQQAGQPEITINLVEAFLGVFALVSLAVAVLSVVSARPTREDMITAINDRLKPLADDITYIRSRLDKCNRMDCQYKNVE